MKRILFGISIVFSFAQIFLSADDVKRHRPAEWDELINGGQFIDFFEPMPIMQPLTSDTWGGENVKPRDVSNGIEEAEWSYWCGYPVRGKDGRYHLFTARWPENEPRGHFGYFDSIIVRAESDNAMGPYTVKETIGPGHNPEMYRNKKGEYVVYSTHGRFFYSPNIDGPWKAGTYIFDKRERYAFKNFVNFSFAPRIDGSMIAVSRRGYIWASADGGDKWSEVSSESVYPNVEGVFEDPVMWKDKIQYHIIVNDWKGRIAYYLRSKDGFHWKTEPGEAYAPGIARYEDGTQSDWYKYERIRVLQDDHGRPVQAHFAVIDSDKRSDLPNDIHNSKHIAIPLTVARLIEVLNTREINEATKEIKVLIKAERGFIPQEDLDFDSLRFGDSIEVNYGRGAALVRTEKSGKNLILVFDGKESGITKENFAGKLLGKTADGKILFAWSRLPEVIYDVSLLSTLSPVFEYTEEDLEAYIEVQNFGEFSSRKSLLKVVLVTENGNEILGSASVRPLRTFEKTMVRVLCEKSLVKGSKHEVRVSIESEGLPTESFNAKIVTPKS